MSSPKTRLDLAVLEKGLASSRQRARALIMAGKIQVNNQPVDKPGTFIRQDDHVVLKGQEIRYVSRGGLKLESALKTFDVAVQDRTCLDVGASTGGFTDCLLQHGARQIFAVDVGYGQFAWKLRNDPRVSLFERTNIRHFSPESIPVPIDLVVIDVSFISLKIVIPKVIDFMSPKGSIIALIKPQFEVGKGNVGKGGVVRDPQQHQIVIEDLTRFFKDINLTAETVIPSPIKGPKGNIEFLIALTYRGQRDRKYESKKVRGSEIATF